MSYFRFTLPLTKHFTMQATLCKASFMSTALLNIVPTRSLIFSFKVGNKSKCHRPRHRGQGGTRGKQRCASATTETVTVSKRRLHNSKMVFGKVNTAFRFRLFYLRACLPASSLIILTSFTIT